VLVPPFIFDNSLFLLVHVPAPLSGLECTSFYSLDLSLMAVMDLSSLRKKVLLSSFSGVSGRGPIFRDYPKDKLSHLAGNGLLSPPLGHVFSKWRLL